MKYVITESKLNNTIKNYIMENYPDVISVTFRKKMIEAYLAGAESMNSGDLDVPTKKEARDWYDNEYGPEESEECDCCEDEFHS
jgi:hypothetical protein